MIWPDGNFVYSNFDKLNRVIKICENGSAGCASGLLVTYTFDPLSRRSAIARPNGASSSFGYDLASRLASLGHDVSGTLNDLSRTFTYNAASQLATRVNGTAAYAHSPAPASTAYAANGRNQYTTIAGATHTHDLNGNLTGDGTRTFGYDAENRLLSVAGSASLTLTYDPLGRLRQTTAGGSTTDFLYAGDRLITEYNGATILKRYAHGPGVDEPIVWYEGANLSTKRWLHPDERGSIVAWTNSSAAATVYRYGTYGEPAGNDFSGSRFRYTGQIALPEVKLYHYKARVYDPALGRFLQTDPVGYQDDFNLYTYVYNDPLNKKDPTGTHSCTTPPCPDIPAASAKVLEAAVAASNNMRVGEGGSEAGAVVLTSKADGSVSRTLTGRDAGRADQNNPGGKFRFRFTRKTTEATGESVHSHPQEIKSGVMRNKAEKIDAENEFPSSTDLKQTMHELNAPLLIKTPSGALREAYRVDGVNHLRTIREGRVPLGPIPADINDNFMVDP